jgi:hypothetical protein
MTLTLAISARPLCGQQPAAAAQGQKPPGESRNEIAVVVAGTHEHEEAATFFTLGVEYERRVAARLGIAGELEYLFVARQWIVAAPVVWHPTRGLKLFGGPGFENAVAEEDDSDNGRTFEVHGERETRFLVRVGAGYSIEFSQRYSIVPMTSLDLVRESGRWTRSTVFGATLGMGF